MTEPSSVRVALELELDGEPIRGSIEHADGHRVSFWSWLELMQTLQAITRDAAPTSRARPHPTENETEVDDA
jgi:hypothetical protein